MARTITEIRDLMLAEKASNANLDVLTSTSATAIWRLIIYIVATGIWLLEKIYDLFRTEIDEKISQLKPHSLRWYAEKAKAFQYGYNLVTDEDYYDNSLLTDTEIANSKVIDYAAVVEQTRGLRIKVATDNGTGLEAVGAPQLASFITYMKRVKDAGVKLSITTGDADSLKATLRIKYNPLVLDSTGARVDGTSPTPVLDAVKAFLKNLPFNGVFSLQKMIDAIQAVEGVDDLNLDSATARYGAVPYSFIDIVYVPDAGYLRLIVDADLTLTFIANG